MLDMQNLGGLACIASVPVQVERNWAMQRSFSHNFWVARKIGQEQFRLHKAVRQEQKHGRSSARFSRGAKCEKQSNFVGSYGRPGKSWNFFFQA